MNARNCPRCGKIFSATLSSVCPSCEQEDAEMFEKVRTYIKENNYTTVTVTSDATGVPAKRILQYLREGRLELPDDVPGELKCGRCGKSIKYGNYCKECAKSMIGQLAGDEDGSGKKGGKGRGMHVNIDMARKR